MHLPVRKTNSVAADLWAARRGHDYQPSIALGPLRRATAWQAGKRLQWLLAFALLGTSARATDFNFHRDTFAFANATVFKYYKGIAFLRAPSENKDPANKYNRRCFVMARGAMQFHKFARFEPRGGPLDDRTLAARIRAVVRRAPWHEALPLDERIVFPGYANLREMSRAREDVVKDKIGLGWPTYIRPSNFRMFYQRSVPYQEQTHERLNAILERGDFFVAYLTTYPRLSINHGVLIYARKNSPPGSDTDRYFVYDPNHRDGPRELTWSAREHTFAYQKDVDFVGGAVRVYQCYGKWLQ
ncbi:MAG: hypothetical protein ABR514_11665 [Chthoniobacterales bacterium]